MFKRSSKSQQRKQFKKKFLNFASKNGNYRIIYEKKSDDFKTEIRELEIDLCSAKESYNNISNISVSNDKITENICDTNLNILKINYLKRKRKLFFKKPKQISKKINNLNNIIKNKYSNKSNNFVVNENSFNLQNTELNHSDSTYMFKNLSFIPSTDNISLCNNFYNINQSDYEYTNNMTQDVSFSINQTKTIEEYFIPRYF